MPIVNVVDAEFPRLSFAVTTYVPAGIEVATVNVPEIWPLPLGPGTMMLHADVPEARPVGAEVREHVVAFELKPKPVTVTTVPKLPFVGDTPITGTSVN